MNPFLHCANYSSKACNVSHWCGSSEQTPLKTLSTKKKKSKHLTIDKCGFIFLTVVKILVVHQIGSFCSIYLGLPPNCLYKEKNLLLCTPIITPPIKLSQNRLSKNLKIKITWNQWGDVTCTQEVQDCFLMEKGSGMC